MKTKLLILLVMFVTTILSCTNYKEIHDSKANSDQNHTRDSLSICQITDTMQQISVNRKFIVFLRIKNYSDQAVTQIIQYNCKKESDSVLVQTSDKVSEFSTPVSYRNTDYYPFDGLGYIEKIELSFQNDRIYFQTEAWVVCPAIHYFDLTTGKICFFSSGWLNKVYINGTLNIEKTGIDYSSTGESNGRYTQECLYDSNGKKIKELSEKKSE